MLTPNEQKRITNWIDEAIGKGTWSTYDDLHIDRINPWIKKKKSQWVNKSFDYLVFAHSYVQQKKDFKVVLAIPLASREIINIDNDSLEQLTGEKLSYTPPSLHLYKDNHLIGNWINKSLTEGYMRYGRFTYFLSQEIDKYENDGSYTNTIHVILRIDAL
jgi:hypothetical protein